MPDLEAIVFDLGTVVSAYVEAVRRRETGEPFYACMIFDDPRCSLVRNAAPQILNHESDHDRRLGLLEGAASGSLPVNGKPAARVWTDIPQDVIAVAKEVFTLSDGVLVRSYAEAGRNAAFHRRPRPTYRVLATPNLPDVHPRGSSVSIVVWAPGRPAEELAFEGMALTEYLAPVTIVCSGGVLPLIPRIAFVAAGDARIPTILEQAGVVVCPDSDDPSTAVGFAKRGFRVAVPYQSGAGEFVPEISLYDGARARSLVEGVAVAQSRPTGDPLPYADPPRAPRVAAVPLPAEALPLVSVIVPTYNRPSDVKAVLGCIGQQTYPNIEAVVVNDCGTSVDEIVATFPFARVINLPQNGGVFKAQMAGLEQARGAFIQFLADDDWLFPDHVQRLVAAMVDRNASAAHANTLMRVQQRSPNGALTTIGFNARTFDDTVTLTDALLSTSVSGQAIMVRREVFDEIGPWRPDTSLADQEFQFRLWARHPVIWVNHMTSEWRVR